MEKEPLSRLEKLAGKAAGAVIAMEYFLCYNNYDGLHTSGLNSPDRFRWLPIEESNFGDTPEMFSAIIASGFIGNKIREYGASRQNKFLETCGKYLPIITSGVVGTYYTLGETIAPKLLPGTADLADVPAVIITAIASPIVANYLVKSWKNGWKEKATNLLIQTNSENILEQKL